MVTVCASKSTRSECYHVAQKNFDTDNSDPLLIYVYLHWEDMNTRIKLISPVLEQTHLHARLSLIPWNVNYCRRLCQGGLAAIDSQRWTHKGKFNNGESKGKIKGLWIDTNARYAPQWRYSAYSYSYVCFQNWFKLFYLEIQGVVMSALREAVDKPAYIARRSSTQTIVTDPEYSKDLTFQDTYHYQS
jgi:hypothetical protein